MAIKKKYDDAVDAPVEQSTEDKIAELLAEAQSIADNPDATDEDKARFDEIMQQVDDLQSKAEMAAKLASVKSTFAVHSKTLTPRKTDPAVPVTDFQKETSKRVFNYGKALFCAMQGRQLDGWEREYSDEASRLSMSSRGGIRVPTRYALDTTTGADGLPKEWMPGQVDFLRAQSILPQLEAAGAQVHENLTQSVPIISQASDPAFKWVGDGADGQSSNPTYAVNTLTSHSAISTVVMTRQLINSMPSGVKYVSDQLQKAIGLGVTQAIIAGSGTSGQPTGILSNSGVLANSVSFASAPTWAKMIALESAVAANNGLTGKGLYISNFKVRGLLKTTVKESGAALGFLLELDGTCNGYDTAFTNLVPSNLGTSPNDNKSAIIFLGDCSYLHVGFFGHGDSVELLVDPYSKSAAGGINVNAYVDMDLVISQANAVSLTLDCSSS